MTYEEEWIKLATIPKRLGRHRTREEVDRMNEIRSSENGNGKEIKLMKQEKNTSHESEVRAIIKEGSLTENEIDIVESQVRKLIDYRRNSDMSEQKTKQTSKLVIPCRDCKDRTPACHSSCELYISWKNDHERAREEASRERMVNGYFSQFHHEEG